MKKHRLDNEVFALRDETFLLHEEKPEAGQFLAVQARSVEMPEGDRSPVRTSDGVPVEQAAIVACQWSDEYGGWQWCPLSPPTKETIGDLLFDNGVGRDGWYYLSYAVTWPGGRHDNRHNRPGQALPAPWPACPVWPRRCASPAVGRVRPYRNGGEL